MSKSEEDQLLLHLKVMAGINVDQKKVTDLILQLHNDIDRAHQCLKNKNYIKYLWLLITINIRLSFGKRQQSKLEHKLDQLDTKGNQL